LVTVGTVGGVCGQLLFVGRAGLQPCPTETPLPRGPMQIMHNDDPSRLCFLLESAEAAAYRAQPKRAAWLLPIIRRLSSTAARLAERMDLANLST
jgi:hypothetical protein